MDFSRDELRRQARDTQRSHDEAMRPWSSALGRIFGSRDVDDVTKADLVAPGLGRRGFIRVGGLTLASAAVLAACGDDKKSSSGSAATTTTADSMSSTTMGKKDAANDILILRTVSSLEALAVAAYQKGIDSGLVKTPAVGDAAKLFQSQHKEHLDFFTGLTSKLGGKPFTDPNPVVLDALQPTIAALKDEAGVVALALSLEIAAAETYQASCSTFTSDLTLNEAVMSVGGVEARHAAILASVLKQMTPPAAFQVTDKAVKAGTGVS